MRVPVVRKDSKLTSTAYGLKWYHIPSPTMGPVLGLNRKQTLRKSQELSDISDDPDDVSVPLHSYTRGGARGRNYDIRAIAESLPPALDMKKKSTSYGTKLQVIKIDDLVRRGDACGRMGRFEEEL